MKNVLSVISADVCTGCCVCANSCSANAIVMKEDKNGFIHPNIDLKKCINCGICVETCPVNTPNYVNKKTPECRAIWVNDEIRMTASSGGVFAAFAEKILKNDGVVCGAAWENNHLVGHILIENVSDLEKIKSSKYIQSNAGFIYKEVKSALDSGKEVLFSGCPCQVAGLYSYLGTNKINKLYTMDIVCHGVPSPKALRKYLEDNFGNRDIEKIDFRDKDVYGWSTEMTIRFSDGEVYRNTHDKDSFYRAFLPCLSLRKACSVCKFSKLPRQGDLTLGDFWGIDRYKKELNDRKGTSLVLVNNENGDKILGRCADVIEKNEIVPIEEALVINKTIAEPFHAHPARKRFFAELERQNFNKLVDNCLTHHYDVGVVGLWYGINYGSILTYYALYEVIHSLGYDPIFLAKPNKLWVEKFNNPDTIAHKFIRPRCNVSNPRDDKDWNQMNNHCDTFILGADVIWNYEICGKDAGQYFFLDFVDSDKKKIAYSSSFGSGYHAPEKERRKSQYYLKRFDYVAVREQEGIRICKEKFGVEATQVLDPVFLLSEEFYRNIIKEAKINDSEKFITTYLLGVNEQKRNFVLNLAEKLNVSHRNFVNPNAPEKGQELLKLPVVNDASVEKWLYYIANCEFFIGDSYHGLCFALIFRKQFVCFVNRTEPSKVRFISLLKLCGLENRLIYTDEDYTSKIEEILKPIDYDTVYAKLNSHIEFSRNWLKNALESPKVTNYSEMDIVEEQIREIAELERRIRRLESDLDEFKRTIDDDVHLKRWIKRNIKKVGKKVWGEIKKKL